MVVCLLVQTDMSSKTRPKRDRWVTEIFVLVEVI